VKRILLFANKKVFSDVIPDMTRFKMRVAHSEAIGSVLSRDQLDLEALDGFLVVEDKGEIKEVRVEEKIPYMKRYYIHYVEVEDLEESSNENI